MLNIELMTSSHPLWDKSGNRLSQRMIEFAGEYLKQAGFSEAYLISDHENLYEKYGYEVVDKKQAPWGSIEKIYKKSSER